MSSTLFTITKTSFISLNKCTTYYQFSQLCALKVEIIGNDFASIKIKDMDNF